MITLERAPLYRRIFTAPIRLHQRFEAWLEDQDTSPFFRRADLLSQIAFCICLIVLAAACGIGTVVHIFKAR